jgi:hypothetical protein
VAGAVAEALPHGPLDPCPLGCPPLFGRAEVSDITVAPLPLSTPVAIFLLARGEHRVSPPVNPEPKLSLGTVLELVVSTGAVAATHGCRPLQRLCRRSQHYVFSRPTSRLTTAELAPLRASHRPHMSQRPHPETPCMTHGSSAHLSYSASCRSDMGAVLWPQEGREHAGHPRTGRCEEH